MPKAKDKAHSIEWWQGWFYKGPRIRNPYTDDFNKAMEWADGWSRKFHGEKP